MAKLPLSLPSLAVVFSLVAATFTVSKAVDFNVTNNAVCTPGGSRFDLDIGADYTKQVLAAASTFVWAILNQPNDRDHKHVNLITCAIDNMVGIANYDNKNKTIHVSSQYIEKFCGDVKTEITGVLYHEITHVWQWTGQERAPSGLIEGVADYVRLKAGYEPLDGHWVKPGEGDRWDKGYDVTAKFLDYCNNLTGGFVAKLNAKMKDGYSDDFFVEMLGKTPEDLFCDYKAAYAS